jgi:hypothetical protein
MASCSVVPAVVFGRSAFFLSLAYIRGVVVFAGSVYGWLTVVQR